MLVPLGDACLPEAKKTMIAQAANYYLLEVSKIPKYVTLSEEAASWVTRILKLLGRSKAAKSIAIAKVDGVLFDKIQNENVVQFGPECIAMAA